MLAIFLCGLIFLQRTKKMGTFFQKKTPQNISAFQLFSLDEFGCNLYQLKITDFSVEKLKTIKKSLRKLKKKSINLINFIFFLLNFLQTNNVFVDHHIVTLYVGNMYVSTHKKPSILKHS